MDRAQGPTKHLGAPSGISALSVTENSFHTSFAFGLLDHSVRLTSALLGLLLLPASVIKCGDLGMAYRRIAKAHLEDDICYNAVLSVLARCTVGVMVWQGAIVSWPVWCLHEPYRALACGTFEWTAQLTSRLVEQQCKFLW